MVASEGRVERYFCDRNLGRRVPDALEAAGWQVERHDDHFAQDTADEVLFREVSRRGWIFLTQDRRIRSRAPERAELLRHGLRTVLIASTANLSAGDTIAALLKAEVELTEAIRNHEPPFIFAVYKDGSIKPIDL